MAPVRSGDRLRGVLVLAPSEEVGDHGRLAGACEAVASTLAVSGPQVFPLGVPPSYTNLLNVTIGRAGVGKQLTNGCVTMAYAMLVGIGLV